MEWYVYYYNINKSEMTTFNILAHYGFRRSIEQAVRKYKKRDEFVEQLRKELQHFFWSKSEYEIIISPWVGGDREKESKKIDVYQQVMLNFDKFADYVWENKKSV